MRKFNSTTPGFTLFELVVSSTIIIVLGSIFMVNYRQQQISQSLKSAADNLESGLRQMQNNILAGELYSPTSPARDYGVKLDLNAGTFETFAEESVTSAYKTLEIVNLGSNVIFNRLTAGSNSLITHLEVRFISPTGKMLISARQGGSVIYTEQANIIGQIRIAHTSTSSHYYIVDIDGASGRIQSTRVPGP